MKVKDLLTDESKWVQHMLARGMHNYPVMPDNPLAVKWCLTGAIHKCYPKIDVFLRVANKVKKEINRNLPNIENNPISKWNDDPQRSFSDIHELINKLDI